MSQHGASKSGFGFAVMSVMCGEARRFTYFTDTCLTYFTDTCFTYFTDTCVVSPPLLNTSWHKWLMFITIFADITEHPLCRRGTEPSRFVVDEEPVASCGLPVRSQRFTANTCARISTCVFTCMCVCLHVCARACIHTHPLLARICTLAVVLNVDI